MKLSKAAYKEIEKWARKQALSAYVVSTISDPNKMVITRTDLLMFLKGMTDENK